MPPWLHQSFSSEGHATPVELLWRIGVAFILGGVVALIYRGTHRSEPITPTFPRTLVLLAILIAMVTSVIGDNVARAFSLVGALSIVRFRTVVRDTQDTAFVIFSVVVGMAAGANHLWVAVIGVAVISTAIFIMRPRGQTTLWTEDECDLSIRVSAGNNPEQLVEPSFKKHLLQSQLLGVATAKQGTALEVTYRVRFRKSSTPLTLIGELSLVNGVQNVEVHREE
ncbi:MAG: DUF4956 domain-containing protein [Verrucomicrobiota bacterium]